MSTFTEKNLLLAWEQGLHRSLIGKSLSLLSLLYPDSDPGELLSLPIGERDAALLHIRRAFFGDWLRNTAACPNCGLKTEWEMPVASLRLQPLRPEIVIDTFQLNYGGRSIEYRLPNSADIMELLAAEDTTLHADLLLNRCIIGSSDPGPENAAYPADLKELLLEKMRENDPQADIELEISCPDCRHRWVLQFDIMQYLWMEVNDWAYRLIRDIGLIAGRFGWSESAILEMSRFRRQLYLNLIRG